MWTADWTSTANRCPQDIYDALHAGDANVGDYDADALILLHLPGGNGPVSAVSVPRDDLRRPGQAARPRSARARSSRPTAWHTGSTLD